MQYRRVRTKGGTYFFTVVTHNRRKILCEKENVALLRFALKYVLSRHPFKIDSFVLLPEHLHCIWTLPEGDCDFSTRWNLVKGYFTKNCGKQFKSQPSSSQKKKREQAIWQPRFWEHQIRDEKDFTSHVEYIHYNPVKHGLAKSPADWQFSSFSRYVDSGLYDPDWGFGVEIKFDENVGRE